MDSKIMIEVQLDGIMSYRRVAYGDENADKEVKQIVGDGAILGLKLKSDTKEGDRRIINLVPLKRFFL